MSTITPQALADLMKSKIDEIDFTSGPIENDALLLAMSEALVVAFSDNTIFANPINNGGVGTGDIFATGSIPTIVWDPAPSGTYTAEDISGLGFANMRFVADTTGGWTITGIGETFDEQFGRWRPTLDNNTVSYEISITASGSAFPIGGIPLNGTWTTLSTNMGLDLSSSMGTEISSVQVEIRQRGNPSNTTGVASFVLRSIGGGAP